MGAAGAIMAGLSISLITGWFLSWMPVLKLELAAEFKEDLLEDENLQP